MQIITIIANILVKIGQLLLFRLLRDDGKYQHGQYRQYYTQIRGNDEYLEP